MNQGCAMLMVSTLCCAPVMDVHLFPFALGVEKHSHASRRGGYIRIKTES